MIKAWWLKLKTEDGMLTIERRDTKVILTVWRTLPLHYTAVRRAPVPLRRFSPSEEHHSTPGLAFLHTATNLNTQTNKKKQIKRQWRVCWFDFFFPISSTNVFTSNQKKGNQSLEVSRTWKGSIRSEAKFTLTRTRDQFRVAQSVRLKENNLWFLHSDDVCVRLQARTGENNCWWQPKQHLCDEDACRALMHRTGLKMNMNTAPYFYFSLERTQNLVKWNILKCLIEGRNWVSSEKSYKSKHHHGKTHCNLQHTPRLAGSTYTDWSSSSGGSCVCDDTLELHVWATGKTL